MSDAIVDAASAMQSKNTAIDIPFKFRFDYLKIAIEMESKFAHLAHYYYLKILERKRHITEFWSLVTINDSFSFEKERFPEFENSEKYLISHHRFQICEDIYMGKLIEECVPNRVKNSKWVAFCNHLSDKADARAEYRNRLLAEHNSDGTSLALIKRDEAVFANADEEFNGVGRRRV